MEKKFGKNVSAVFLTYCVNRERKEFQSKWYPTIEFGGEMMLIRDPNANSINGCIECDTKEEAILKANEFLTKMMEKYPEDFAETA